MPSSFVNSKPFDERKAESKRIIEKHPDRIPIICERSKTCSTTMAEIDKKKYLVPKDMTIGQFIYVVRKRINVKKEDALFIFINNNHLPQSSDVVVNVYSAYKNADGFLYMEYSSENTFGDLNLHDAKT